MKDGWIKITDRLPDEDGYYLVYDDSDDFDIAHWDSDDKRWDCDVNWRRWEDYEDYKGAKVTHWQPLEEPIK